MIPDPGFQRRSRKRASQACQQCRRRKVKCNIVDVGTPCHNCQVDDNECITLVSRRSRRYRHQKHATSHLHAFQPLLLPQPTPAAQSVCSNASQRGNATQIPVTPSSGTHDSPNTMSTDESHVPSFSGAVLNSTEIFLPPVMSATAATAQMSVHFPSYIRPRRRNLRPDELKFLKSRGALSIPATPIRDKPLISFLLYVNPFLPVVDVQDFISAIEGESGTQVSLLLFQAVMFAGSTFVDSQILLDAGFKDRTTARAHYFEAVKARQDKKS